MRKWLRELREERGIKQNEISKKLGITQCAYSLFETGKRHSKMTIETARKLAEIFNLPLETVLKNENDLFDKGV